ncbi:agmatinase [Geosporobacter subterraneus DSM 17957]|uniref:Agmatinase n=1 Tax=Geosporobacter subterraneus DSM 17957 TaxID=1121919 RepID=A0A1M6C754_9FIRM|nr:agmatinase [Geosporobacter subterraneus]SHI56594.1 agmatinase [Geosporobacter subterraneus DSM 17957]
MELFNRYCFIGCEKSFEESDVIIFGAPFDGTCSFRPGSRFAPNKIRIDSYGLETYSPYLDRDLLDRKIHDAGDIDLIFGNKYAVLDTIKEYAQHIMNHQKKPLMIGGEHLVTLPVVSALFEKHPDLVLLHFDAHTDLRGDYMGEELSHATVIKQIWDFLGDGRIYQFGIRSGLKEEFYWAEKEGHTFMNKYGYDRLDEAVQKIKDKPVYVTIDLDILDPSIFPGTGTPEPGGITFKDMLDILQKLDGLNIVGADVVELAPDYDPTGVSTAVASKILRELMLIL